MFLTYLCVNTDANQAKQVPPETIMGALRTFSLQDIGMQSNPIPRARWHARSIASRRLRTQWQSYLLDKCKGVQPSSFVACAFPPFSRMSLKRLIGPLKLAMQIEKVNLISVCSIAAIANTSELKIVSCSPWLFHNPVLTHQQCENASNPVSTHTHTHTLTHTHRLNMQRPLWPKTYIGINNAHIPNYLVAR
jgi:hypothetical protein